MLEHVVRCVRLPCHDVLDLAANLDHQTRSAEHRWLTLKNALVVFQVAVSAGALAPRAAWRSAVVPRPVLAKGDDVCSHTETETAGRQPAETPDASRRRARGRLWADLMQRTSGSTCWRARGAEGGCG